MIDAPNEQERRAIAEERIDAPPFRPPHVAKLVDPFDDLTLAEGAEVRALRRRDSFESANLTTGEFNEP